ncbi:MAG: potassium transporter TrkG [Phycisphaerae bacterium]
MPRVPAESARSERRLAAAVALAAVAVLARDAGGAAVLPGWAEMAIQTPALLLWLRTRCGRSGLGRDDRWPTLAVLVGGGAIAIFHAQPALFFLAATGLIAGSLLLDALHGVYRRIETRIEEPARLLRTLWPPWFCLVLAATVLLSLPIATRSGVPDYRHGFWDHVLNNGFAAMSFGCLIGRSVYSFATEYTRFGQIVLLVVTEWSGITFCAVGLCIMRPFLRRPIRLRTVVRWALGLQLFAVVALWSAWRATDAPGAGERFWWGLVHAADAVWNTGTTLRTDGLASYLPSRTVFVTVLALSIVGSLGLPILLDLIRRAPKRPDRPESARVAGARLPCRRLAQYEAGAALALLALGAVLLFYFETPGTLPPKLIPVRPFDLGGNQVAMRDNLGLGGRWTLAAFVSTTLRSAGLQSISVAPGALAWPSYGLLLLWMFIGGSAGGPAGGVRVTSFVLPLICLVHGREAWAAEPGGAAVRRLILRRVPLFAAGWLGINALAIGSLTAVSDWDTYSRVFEATAAINGLQIASPAP